MNETTAAFQLEFLGKVERLLATGGFTATYKFALLIALANLAVEKGHDSGKEMRVDLGELAREFTRLYWNSARPYPGTGEVLRHSRTTGNAAILRLLAPHVEAYGRPEEAMRRSPEETRQLVEKVRREVLCRYPIYHLQLFEGASTREKLFDDFLYELPSADESERIRQREIHLKPSVAACLRSLHGIIVSMCEASWARWIRERNDSLGADRQLEAFLFGQDREALSRLAKPLHEMQEGRCFYSGDRLKTPASGEVDHFIPWSLYPCNSPFNLVLVTPKVNRAKSNLLPSSRHLQDFVRRNREKADVLTASPPRGCGARIDDGPSVDAIVRWAYSGANRVRRYCWDSKSGGRLVALEARWERALA